MRPLYLTSILNILIITISPKINLLILQCSQGAASLEEVF